MSATEQPAPAAGTKVRTPRARRKHRPNPSVPTLVRAQEYVDAGDRCAAAGDRDGALSCYGRALNDYLREGVFGLAASVARRMVERYPDVVRARMTIAALTLAEGLSLLSAGGMRNTCTDFDEYVRVARAAGQEELAIRQLRRFAAATESAPVRERIGEFLQQLGDPRGAEDLPPLDEAGAEAAEEGVDQRTRWVEILLTPAVAD